MRRQRHCVWRLGHDLAARRRRERCSVRSWASLRR
jgi:hypothetical protein